MVNLIPKQEKKPVFGQWFFLIASVLLVAGVGIGFFVLIQLEGSAREILKGLDETIQRDIQPQEQALEAEITEVQKSIERFRLAASQRKDLLPLFALLEATTVKGIVLESLNANRISESILINGAADTFFVLEQQRLVWEENSEIQKVNITDMELDSTGNISFAAELHL